MSLVINSLLKDRYRITAVLAQSGMGTVYQGYDETLNIQVAVKENRYTTEIHSRQFRNEATLLAGLRPPQPAAGDRPFLCCPLKANIWLWT